MPRVLRIGAIVFAYLGASYGLSGQTPDSRLDDAVRARPGSDSSHRSRGTELLWIWFSEPIRTKCSDVHARGPV